MGKINLILRGTSGKMELGNFFFAGGVFSTSCAADGRGWEEGVTLF